MGERYFITGAQGCIGSWIVKALIERGDEAIVFDRSDDSRRLGAVMSLNDLARVRFVTGDITEGAAATVNSLRRRHSRDDETIRGTARLRPSRHE